MGTSPVKVSIPTRTVPPLDHAAATHDRPGREFTPRRDRAGTAPREDFAAEARTKATTGTALVTMRDVAALDAAYAAVLVPSASVPFVVQQLHQLYAPDDTGRDPRGAIAAYRTARAFTGAHMPPTRISA